MRKILESTVVAMLVIVLAFAAGVLTARPAHAYNYTPKVRETPPGVTLLEFNTNIFSGEPVPYPSGRLFPRIDIEARVKNVKSSGSISDPANIDAECSLFIGRNREVVEKDAKNRTLRLQFTGGEGQAASYSLFFKSSGRPVLGVPVIVADDDPYFGFGSLNRSWWDATITDLGNLRPYLSRAADRFLRDGRPEGRFASDCIHKLINVINSDNPSFSLDIGVQDHVMTDTIGVGR